MVKGKYKDSLNLPSTDFPMRGDLARREPEMLAAWEETDLYGEIQRERTHAPRFILHDGPPYSNGHIHYGHILNKVLKDVVVRYHTMAGHRSPYVPGWDTHGLPIELAVDRQLGDRKAALSVAEIRRLCREYALRFVDIQREEFKRLGVLGRWDKPYLTLDPGYDAAIVRALACFARAGYLYRGKKPVYWCPADGTALAEAEIEYHDHVSPSIYVRLPMAEDFDPAALDDRLAGKPLSLAIWTTTPWTLPANLAVAVNPGLDYVAVPAPGGGAEYFLVARGLARSFLAAIGDPAVPETDDHPEWIAIARERLETALVGARYQHPFVSPQQGTDHGGDNAFRVWLANYVTLEQGTGLVHTAPGHGAEDYVTGVKNGLEPYSPVDAQGRFTEGPWRGQSITEANPAIVEHLHQSGYLLNRPGETVAHSYAHCWRCKGPTLFRATPQWFISIDHRSLRSRALDEIDRTEWIPGWGRNRIHSMIENRPDWCLSRQRVWGVPIPAFHCDDCGEAIADAEIMEHVADLFAASDEGADAWYIKPESELLPPGSACPSCDSTNLRRETDIVDVWFESGCSWFNMTLSDRDLGDIDLYLEGSDQHRGWFHSSLLVGIGVAGCAPYKSVITHGWVLDEDGRPYSKSEIEKARQKGQKVEYVPPQDIIDKNGAELLRLWVGSTDYRGDVPFSKDVIQGLSDWYRKFRNTCRFMLGNLHDFDPGAHPLDSIQLRGLDRYMLARLGDLVARVRDAYQAHEFHTVHRALVDFVTGELSALYLDVVKDRLYTSAPDAPGRRAAQVVLYHATRVLAVLSAPITCFTSEDIWTHLPKRPRDPRSVHLALMPEGKRMNPDSQLARSWALLLSYRERVTKALEDFRARKNRSLDARVTITPRTGDRTLLEAYCNELPELFIVSDVVMADHDVIDPSDERFIDVDDLLAADEAVANGAVGDGTGASAPAGEPVITVTRHDGHRCERCWKWFRALAHEGSDLCTPCDEAMAAHRAGDAPSPTPENSTPEPSISEASDDA